VPVCDGCGERVDDGHIRQRIARLEVATRFRPIHINVLLMDAAPPARREDFFYDASSPLRARSAAVQAYLAELTKLAGVAISPDTQLEPVLAEFQHRGFFLASAVECPMGDYDNLPAAIRCLAPTVALRVQASYKPKWVALISQPTRELIEPLRVAGWGDRLILDNGAPFGATIAACSTMGKLPNQTQTATSLGDRLVAVLSRLS
jgi:hypothetical protein